MNLLKPLKSMLSILFLCFSVTQAEAIDLLVPSEYPTIQQAIFAANSGDQILVSPGTYQENLSYIGKDISILSTAGSDQTTIDGSLLTLGPDEGATVTFSGGETELAILDGFTITGGTGRPITDSSGTYRRGGGIRIFIASPTIKNCVLSGNSAEFGSGLYAEETLSLDLSDVSISGNNALEGAGIYLSNCGVINLQNCSFSNNSSLTAGGGITLNLCSQVSINTCSFQNNSAIIGGGIYSRISAITMSNLQLSNNQASLLGGAITLYQSTTTIDSSSIIGNFSSRGGGIGLDGGTLSINSSIIASNTANTNGGAIASTINLTEVEIHRSTITGNTSGGSSGGVFYPPTNSGGALSTLLVNHCLLWNPVTLEIDIPTLAQVDYSVISSGYPGSTVFLFDPVFTNPLIEDFSLDPNSPAIDAGDPLYGLDPDNTAPDLGAIFYDQRPLPLLDFSCSIPNPCSQEVTLNWESAGPADFFLISGGPDPSQLLPITTVLGTETSLVHDPGLSGMMTYCVEPSLGGFTPATGASCCEINVPPLIPQIPISNLICNLDTATCIADLTWVNESSYSSINLQLGATSLTLPGNVTSVTLPAPLGLNTTAILTPVSTCGALLLPVSCQIFCPSPGPLFIRGDVNLDGIRNLADVSSQLSILFQSVNHTCLDAVDTNDDGNIDISDPVFMLLFLYSGGLAPAAPGATCGIDTPTQDFLPCQTGQNCP